MLDQPELKEQKEVTAGIFLNKNVKILEMNSKSGLYPLYLAYSLYRTMLPKDETDLSMEEAQAYWRKVLQDNIYVLCQTRMAVSITKRTLAGYTDMGSNVIFLTKLLDRMQDKKRLSNKLKNPETWGKEGEKMKFDAIVGNPPYQLAGASGGTNDAPIYQNFAQIAMALKPQYISLIMPSRWFSAGRENLLGDFRQTMLTSRSIRSMFVYADSHDVFGSVDIKGGICYYLQDTSYSGDCEYTLFQNGEKLTVIRDLGESDILIRDPRLSDIVKKVMTNTDSYKCVDKLISGDTPFGIPTNPKTSGKNRIQLSEVRTERCQVALLYLDNFVRTIGYVSGSDIRKNEQDIWKIKVFVPKAAGTGNDPYVIGRPEYMPGESVCSQTFLYAAFDSEEEARNFISYMKTKFFRALVSARKVTQDVPSKTYRFVPIQDFTRPWKDAELYAMYDLSDDDIDYIESAIQPME